MNAISQVSTELTLCVIICWFTLVELILDKTVKESETKVHTLFIHLLFINWNIENELLTVADIVISFKYKVIHCPDLSLNHFAAHVVLHYLFHIFIILKVKSRV